MQDPQDLGFHRRSKQFPTLKKLTFNLWYSHAITGPLLEEFRSSLSLSPCLVNAKFIFHFDETKMKSTLILLIGSNFTNLPPDLLGLLLKVLEEAAARGVKLKLVTQNLLQRNALAAAIPSTPWMQVQIQALTSNPNTFAFT